MNEVHYALQSGITTLHAKIKGRFTTKDEDGNVIKETHETTPGRLLMGELLPKYHSINFSLCNKVMTKKYIKDD